MNTDSVMSTEGYFLSNFLKRTEEDEAGYDADFIDGTEFEQEWIMTPGMTYNDHHQNVSYEELAMGFGMQRQ